MELHISEITLTLAEEMELCIPDDAVMISVKYNLRSDDDVEDQTLGASSLLDIRQYFLDNEVNIIASSVGLHTNGKKQKPHIHYHIVAEKFQKPSNPSQHRARWLSKKENEDKNLDNISVMYQKLDTTTPKYSFLSYPLKEGKIPPWCLKSRDILLMNSKKMTYEELQFLKNVGREIYEKEQGLRLRQDKCEERKQLALASLFELCDKNKNIFHSYKSMLSWLDDNFISTLDINEYPDPRNYKTNTQKIAIKLGYLKYSDL